MKPSRRLQVVVAGAIANKPHNGGEAWVRLSWLRGIERLGADVTFVEEIERHALTDKKGRSSALDGSVNARQFLNAAKAFGLDARAGLVLADGDESIGLGIDALQERIAQADLLVNVSGHLTMDRLSRAARRAAYVDIDPGFTQMWHATGASGLLLDGHDVYFTIGENIGHPDCPIPTGGINWIPTRQPVVLDDWPIVPDNSGSDFTSIARWRPPFGPLEYDGRKYGLRVHEFRKFVDLPRRVPYGFEVALDIDPTDLRDRTALENAGWRLVDPLQTVPDTDSFRRYIQRSRAEFSVAQGVYVDTNSGWFSDRSVRYLASGKPVLVQETGASRWLPTGEGVVTFRDLDEAVAGAHAIMHDYERHSRVARRLAEEYFDSDRVLTKFLHDAGVVV